MKGVRTTSLINDKTILGWHNDKIWYHLLWKFTKRYQKPRRSKTWTHFVLNQVLHEETVPRFIYWDWKLWWTLSGEKNFVFKSSITNLWGLCSLRKLNLKRKHYCKRDTHELAPFFKAPINVLIMCCLQKICWAKFGNWRTNFINLKLRKVFWTENRFVYLWHNSNICFVEKDFLQ